MSVTAPIDTWTSAPTLSRTSLPTPQGGPIENRGRGVAVPFGGEIYCWFNPGFTAANMAVGNHLDIKIHADPSRVGDKSQSSRPHNAAKVRRTLAPARSRRCRVRANRRAQVAAPRQESGRSVSPSSETDC